MAADQILGNTKGGSSLMLWSPNTRANTLSGQLRSGATLVEKRTHLPKTTSRVRDAVSERLAAPTGPSSRDPDGQPRVLTTNFDTLFEHAAVESGVKDVTSHACKSLPKPGGAQDFEILHLHGRIAGKAAWVKRERFGSDKHRFRRRLFEGGAGAAVH